MKRLSFFIPRIWALFLTLALSLSAGTVRAELVEAGTSTLRAANTTEATGLEELKSALAGLEEGRAVRLDPFTLGPAQVQELLGQLIRIADEQKDQTNAFRWAIIAYGTRPDQASEKIASGHLEGLDLPRALELLEFSFSGVLGWNPEGDWLLSARPVHLPRVGAHGNELILSTTFHPFRPEALKQEVPKPVDRETAAEYLARIFSTYVALARSEEAQTLDLSIHPVFDRRLTFAEMTDREIQKEQNLLLVELSKRRLSDLLASTLLDPDHPPVTSLKWYNTERQVSLSVSEPAPEAVSRDNAPQPFTKQELDGYRFGRIPLPLPYTGEWIDRLALSHLPAEPEIRVAAESLTAQLPVAILGLVRSTVTWLQNGTDKPKPWNAIRVVANAEETRLLRVRGAMVLRHLGWLSRQGPTFPMNVSLSRDSDLVHFDSEGDVSPVIHRTTGWIQPEGFYTV